MSRFRYPAMLLISMGIIAGCTSGERAKKDTATEGGQSAAAVEDADSAEPAEDSDKSGAELVAWAEGLGAKPRTDDQGRIVLIDFTDSPVATGAKGASPGRFHGAREVPFQHDFTLGHFRIGYGYR